AIKLAVRLYDVPTRYGGDEFAIILPEADTEVASRVGRRVLEKLEQVSIPSEMRDAGMPLQVSIGIATLQRPLGDAKALFDAPEPSQPRRPGSVSRRSRAACLPGAAASRARIARAGMERGGRRPRWPDPNDRDPLAELPRCRCDLESDRLRDLSGL